MRQSGGLRGSETQPWETSRQINAPRCHGNNVLFICLGILLFHMHFLLSLPLCLQPFDVQNMRASSLNAGFANGKTRAGVYV